METCKSKTCYRCNSSKALDSFNREKRNKDGLRGICKSCDYQASLVYQQKYRTQQPKTTVYKSFRRELGSVHRICTGCRTFKPVNSFRKAKALKDGLASNCRECESSKWATRMSKPGARDKERIRTSALQRKIRSTAKGQLDNAISVGVFQSLKLAKKNRKSFDLLGYSLEELMWRLESKFASGMSWANYGKWHVDHIRPKSSYKYSSPDDIEFKECWGLLNLQPLWAQDNLRKSDKC